MGAVVGFTFMGWVPIIPQRGVPEDTVVSHACLYLRDWLVDLLFFSLCLTFMRRHWEWSQMPGVSKGNGDGPAGQMPLSKDGDVFLKHWGKCMARAPSGGRELFLKSDKSQLWRNITTTQPDHDILTRLSRVRCYLHCQSNPTLLH